MQRMCNMASCTEIIRFIACVVCFNIQLELSSPLIVIKQFQNSLDVFVYIIYMYVCAFSNINLII